MSFRAIALLFAFLSLSHEVYAQGLPIGPPVSGQPEQAPDPPAQAPRICVVFGLDPNGDNWLALRNRPSFQSSWSTTHMTPGMQVAWLGRAGEWINVRLSNGETGWANSNYLSCS